MRQKKLTKRNIVVYVAGKYTDKDKKKELANIKLAERYAAKIWDLGFSVICIHANISSVDKLCKKTSYNDFMDGCLNILDKCDVLFLLTNWKDSKGATIEYKYAKENNIWIVDDLKFLKGEV